MQYPTNMLIQLVEVQHFSSSSSDLYVKGSLNYVSSANHVFEAFEISD